MMLGMRASDGAPWGQEWMFGEWDVTQRFTGFRMPLGEQYVPAWALASAQVRHLRYFPCEGFAMLSWLQYLSAVTVLKR